MSYNVHKDGQNNLLIGKLNTEYEVEWFTPFPGTPMLYKGGVDVDLKDGYMYVTRGEVDSANASSIYHTVKLRMSDGDTIWTASYHGSYNGYTFASSVIADDTGNVYVAGFEQSNLLDSKMTVVKYDSGGTLLWSSSYDSVGLFDGAVAVLPQLPRAIVTTGFSGTGWGNWDFNTVDFSPGDGSVLTYNRIPNGSGTFSKPVALRKDEHQNIYVLGTSVADGVNTDIKLIKYDSLFNQKCPYYY